MPQQTTDNTEQPPAQEAGGGNNTDHATDTLRFEKWLAELGERKGTDLHLTVGNVPMIRLNGKIEPISNEQVLTAEAMESIVSQLLTDDEAARLTSARQIVLSRTLKRVMRFRVHVFYSRGFLAVSLRHLPSEGLPFDQLALPQMVHEFVQAEQGIYLVAGPFDSGRTTTVKGIVGEMNRTQERYIVMLEEPIEYIIPSDKSIVAQREVGKDVASFSEGLAALHDEDVDVVVVSSFAGAEVVEQSLGLAASGRLVIAITDGRHVVGVLEDIRDSVPAPDRPRILNVLADNLLGITTQLLLPRVGGGRVLVAEVMRATNPIKSLIRENKLTLIPNVMQTSRQEGMITLDKSLVEAVKQGVVSLRDAKEHAVDNNQFNLLASH